MTNLEWLASKRHHAQFDPASADELDQLPEPVGADSHFSLSIEVFCEDCERFGCGCAGTDGMWLGVKNGDQDAVSGLAGQLREEIGE